MEDGFLENENVQSSQTIGKGNKNHTGAKKVAKTIGVLALVASLGVGIYFGHKAIKDFNETRRVDQMISLSSIASDIVVLPDTMNFNQAYDAKYCSGEKLVDRLVEAGIQYCCIEGEYYTQTGEPIAILTLEVTETEVIDAIKVDVDGKNVYVAPVGYTLDGTKCIKDFVRTETVVVPQDENADYSYVTESENRKCKIVSVEEKDTVKFSALNNHDLIVDVPDDAVLSNGQTAADLSLVLRSK